MVNPILVALDVSDITTAETLARSIAPHVGGFKVGLELLMSEGHNAVERIANLGKPVFADAKLHDIPNTVRRAAGRLGLSGARWVTAHASGGVGMLEAAAEGLSSGGRNSETGILAVTVLTSMDDEDLEHVGVNRPVKLHILTLARVASEAGSEGVICSPFEAAAVKKEYPGLIAVTPGIRPADTEGHDQKRIATPAEAIGLGADLLVVGRAITASPDPVTAAKTIFDSLGVEPA